MLIVAGYLTVAAAGRESYLAGCAAVVEQARRTPGCLDFAISADPLDPRRINVFERWQGRAELDAFRGDGPDDEQGESILDAEVAEYDVLAEQRLTAPDLE